jgi:uridine phosphorylase
MTDEAWYLGCRPDEVAERAVLVGDPGRIDLFIEQLDDVHMLGDNRGLRAITGMTGDLPVTVCAFGMGAPIAAVVLEELAQLGVTTALRVGTVMTLVPDGLGELIVASAAIREESVSRTYAPVSVPATPDLDLFFATLVALERQGEQYRTGIVATLDGFYTEMLAARAEREHSVAERLSKLKALGAVAVDMETSALLTVGRCLGLATGSLCLATVEAATRARLDGRARVEAERRLVTVTLVALQIPDQALKRAVQEQAHTATGSRQTR